MHQSIPGPFTQDTPVDKPGQRKPESWEREGTFYLGGLQCYTCAQRAEVALERLDGVQAAAIGLLRDRVRVRYDARYTSAQEIAAGLRRAGVQAETASEPAPKRPGVRLGISAVAFANLLGIEQLSGQGEDPSVGLVQLALTVLVLLVSGLPLLRQAIVRRLEGPELLVCAGALVSFGLGLFEIATAQPALLSIPGFFAEVRFAAPLFGFKSAAGIVLLACLAQHAAAALRRFARGRLVASSKRGLRDLGSAMDASVDRALARIDAGRKLARPSAWSSIGQRTVLVSALSFATFALLLHSWLDGTPLYPSAFLPAIAVLVSASTAAFSVATPAAHAIAVLRARAAGMVIKDASTLEILADASVACFDLSFAAPSGAPTGDRLPWRLPSVHATVRAVWRRSLGVRLLSSDPPELTMQVAHWLGVPCSAGLSPTATTRSIEQLQRGGACVLLVSAGSPRIAGAAAADVTVAIAPGTPPDAVGAPIVASDAELDRLPDLLDLAWALRCRLRENTALSLIYNALVIPAATLGWLSPLQAASLLLIETLLVLTNAARLLTIPVAAIAPGSLADPDIDPRSNASAQGRVDPDPHALAAAAQTL
jgi:cation transport ATPase